MLLHRSKTQCGQLVNIMTIPQTYMSVPSDYIMFTTIFDINPQ